MSYPLLLLCFFLSGFAALLYETAWTREFEFVFGTSELAVVSVLAAYMAGLAAGSASAGRLVGRVRRPVLWYGLLELGIALSALAVPWAIRAATWLQSAAMGGRSAPPDAESVSAGLFYLAFAFLILVVPTGFMGATLPLLARHAVRREEEIGRRVGTLYAVNTAGAVAGAITTAFLLLPEFGLRSTVFVGAGANALVFGAAALLAGRAGEQRVAPTARETRRPRFHWVLPLTALSGAVAFTYEVLWTRLLGHLVGGTVQGFATMLASFLLGIAIGSSIAARLARDPLRSVHGLAIAQLATAVLSLLAFVAVDRLPELAVTIGAGKASTPELNGVIAILGLLPSSICIGAVFPFAVRILARDESEAGPAAARVFAWNTLGAIAGVLASGFALLPALRFEGTLSLAAGVNLVLALAVACLATPAAKVVAALAVAGLAALPVVRPAPPWQVLRHAAMPAGQSTWGGEVVYYGVGRSSTVLLLEQPRVWDFTTNGLPESSVDRSATLRPQTEPATWLSMLPVLLRPDLRSMLIVGLGGALTVEAVPPTIESITVIELEREVIRAHEELAIRRGSSPLHDPRVHVVVNDARGALELTDARFGAIVSQPSHPWTAGASHLYTREFFSLAAEHLERGGVLVQWIGLPFVDEALLRSLVATLWEVFPHVALFRPVPGAVLFTASDEPLEPLESAGRGLALAPSFFARFGLRLGEDVAAGWVLDGRDARAFAEGAAVLTDDRNPLAMHAARLRGRGARPERVDELLAPYEPLSLTAAALDPVYLVRRLVAMDAGSRAVRLAETVSDPTQRSTLLGWALSLHTGHRAAAEFRAALARDPTSQSARFGLVRLSRDAVTGDEAQTRELVEPLQAPAALVVSGWRHAARDEWAELQALEPALASVDLRDPSQPDALRLRIRWRAESVDPALREQAAAMAKEMLHSTSQLPEDVVLAAEAFAAAHKPDDALRLLDFLSRSRRGRRSLRAGLELLDELRSEVDSAEWTQVRQRLLRRLG